jgi:hypothetical protein
MLRVRRPAANREAKNAMVDPVRYEDYFHRVGDLTTLQEEFSRRQDEGWSLWRAEPDGDRGVRLTFRYPSEWSPSVEPMAAGTLTPAESEPDEPSHEEHDRHDPQNV